MNVDPLDGQLSIDSVKDERRTDRLPCRAPRGALRSRRRLLAPLLPGTAFIGEARIGGQVGASPPSREGRPDALRPKRQAPHRPSQPHLTGPERSGAKVISLSSGMDSKPQASPEAHYERSPLM
jgi:hypothetical protein